MPVVAPDRLSRIYRAIATAHGASSRDANTFAAGLLKADLRGYTGQGIAVAPYYHKLLRNGVLKFGHAPSIEREGPAFAALDGHRNVGQVIGTRAMQIAIEKARDCGIGIVTVSNSGDFAMASNYTLQAARENQIGIAMGNGYPLVAPWCGRDPFFCTNPLSIAVPAGEKAPIVIDMATSAYSMSHVVRAARDGCRLGSKAVVDSDGRYSDNPRAVVADPMDRESPLNGAILPAGPKGFCWVLIVEVLSGILSGAQGSYVNLSDPRPSPRTKYGHCFVAIDVNQLIGTEHFSRDIEIFIEALRSSRPAEGFEEVRIPGERAAREEQIRRASGVPVRDEEWELALALGDEIGIDLSTL
jgi:LDH2 family malate/lactate/ureidoglycolate dehydrogenase